MRSHADAVVAERTVPYPPSWVDRLEARIDALPVAPWIPYVAVFAILAVVSNAANWADGSVAVGTFDPYVNSAPVYVVLGFGAIHYLDRAAGRAWAAFRPTLAIGDEEANAFVYQLTTMPARLTLGATMLGLLIGVAFVVSQYGKPYDLDDEPLIFIGSVAFTLVGYAGSMIFAYHALHQLRLIGRVHRYVESIDLLYLDRLHAFAGVTATTGVVLLAIGYLGVLTVPSPVTNPALIASAIAVTGLAVAIFVVPLYGIRGLIAAEKSRRLEATNRLLDAALRDLHRRAEEGDLSEADAVNKHLLSLLAEREVLARTPTWPWAPETLRGFATALVLPVVLWFAFRVLGQALG